MTDLAADIKSMKLYSHIDRVLNELAEIGKDGDAPLSAEELSAFDQLHYHGTDAVDRAIEMIGIDRDTRVLEIGSGFGGPARHIAHNTRAQVTALELQPDQDRLAATLTARCGLSSHLAHVCGDALAHDWRGQAFDAIVSWLTLYHIADRDRLLAICAGLLPVGGAVYAEDLFGRRAFDAAERAELASGLYAGHLPDFDSYQAEFARAGFAIAHAEDLSDDWTRFTTERLRAYRADRARHVRVHGAPTFDALESFYDLVNRHFRSGKLGGIRLLARKA
ncbi:MAG: class I SAM-dependent methyltransferase [bacterium]